MDLSCYYNYGSLQQQQHCLNQQDTPSVLKPTEQQDLFAWELLGFHDNFDTCIDPLFEPYSSYDTTCFPAAAANSDNVVLQLQDQFEPFQYCPPNKRSKIYEEEEPHININNNSADFIMNPGYYYSGHTQFPSPFLSSSIFPPTYSLPVVGNNNNHNLNKQQEASSTISGKCLSAQSMAARQRRRKISEKIQELGKLIPGGQKMNTAEMFQAAYKYVKFLQSQVGIMEFMTSITPEENEEEPFYTEELQGLVGSRIIQQKLYASENCLVPRKLVQVLSEDHDLEPNPVVLTLHKSN